MNEIEQLQNAEYQYRFVYRFKGFKRILCTFETQDIISLVSNSFVDGSFIIGHVSSKAISHPEGGHIYRLDISHKLIYKITEWLLSIRADNLTWNPTIYLKEHAPVGYEIFGRVSVDL